MQLSQAQQEIVEQVRELTTVDWRDEPRIIVVQGFSGVGKSAVTEYLREELEAEGNRILDPNFQAFNFLGTVLKMEGHFIIPAGFYQAGRLAEIPSIIEDPLDCGYSSQGFEGVKQREVCILDLKGMTEEEARTFAKQEPQGTLSIDELVACSLGIPGIIKQVDSIPHLDFARALRIGGMRIGEALPEAATFYEEKRDEYLAQFLCIEPTADLLEEIEKSFTRSRITLTGHQSEDRHIYDHLREVGQEHRDVDVTFKAAESVAMYSTILGKRFGGITIKVPGLSPENFEELMKMLGFTGQEGEYQGVTNRRAAFMVYDKELSLYGNDGEREIGLCEGQEMYSRVMCRNREEREVHLRELGTDLIPLEREGDGYVSISVNDHGYQTNDPLRVGWMVESYLQQKGIGYVARGSTSPQIRSKKRENNLTH
jgi:hypothetical protein